MTHPDTKPEALRIADAVFAHNKWLWRRYDGAHAQCMADAAYELRRLHPFEAECERLKAICVAVHDRLLRGEDDRDLLAMLEEAWKK